MITYSDKNDDNKDLNRGAWIIIILISIAFVLLLVKTTSYPF